MQQEQSEQPPAVAVQADLAMSFGRANAIAFGFVPVGFVLFILPHWLIWGSNPFRETGPQFSLLRVVAVFIGSIIVHEILHALGFVLFGGVAWSAIRFGFNWRALAAYACCRVPVPASAYRGATALPGMAMGVIPAVLGVASGIGGLTLWGAVMFLVAAGDFAVLWLVRKVPASARVLDHSEKAGCLVLAE